MSIIFTKACDTKVDITVERKHYIVRVSKLCITASDDVDLRCLHLQSRPIGCWPLLYLEHSSGKSYRYTHTQINLCVCIELTIYCYIKTAEQQTVIHAANGDWHTGRWWVGCYIWYSEERPGRAVPPPSALLTVPNSPPINGQCTNFILFDFAL